ncbi:MAG: acyl--CoA ligase [Clostridia bacterium]|nr:acyl--CoA ligase [Clostridia bacterium]MBQ7046681.1 acyl--CoA ligase [Oscillospiraceae bacterium]
MGILWEFLSEKVLSNPSKLLADGNGTITYKELHENVMLLSRKLKRHCKYAILCESELYAATAILACFASGAVAVPMSVRYGGQHKKSIVESIKISWLISDEGIKRIDEDAEEADDLSDTAVIMCTSGTTGKPKGVKLSEENILSNLTSIQDYFKLTDTDRILILRSLFHISALTGEFLTALSAGADICFFGNSFLPIVAAKTVVDNDITVLCATPTLLNQLCSIFSRTNKQIPLRKVVVSGECLTRAVADRMISTLPEAELLNVYGLTEASPRVSALLPEDFEKYPESVGKPIKNVEVKIVDGELCVRGKNVMQGYYLNPEATKKKIIDGWLHTGDVAELKDGFLYIKGRLDDMIIRAGVNIYPQEIENVLLRSPGIREALALEKDGRILVKLVGTISKKEALTICQKELPTYAIPEQIEFVESLPKTATGKLVRHD